MGLISHFVNQNHDRSHHTLEVPPLGGVLLQGIDPVVIGSAPIYRSHELRPFGRGPTTRSFGKLGDHYGYRIGFFLQAALKTTPVRLFENLYLAVPGS